MNSKKVDFTTSTNPSSVVRKPKSKKTKNKKRGDSYYLRYRGKYRNDSFVKQCPYVEIYTKGFCLTNPGGPGGWAASIRCTKKHQLKQNNLYKEIYGSVDVRTQTLNKSYADLLLEDKYVDDEHRVGYAEYNEYIRFSEVTFYTITNNRMEMLAVVQALRCLKRSCNIKLYSDSEYLLRGMSVWNRIWAASNWIQKNRKYADSEGFVKNHDLWRELYRLSLRHKIEYRWVKSHSGNVGNDNVDRLATTSWQQSKCDGQKK